MVALYTVWYNFVRVHKTLRMTPAMAAGVTDTLRDMEWIAGLIDAAAPKPARSVQEADILRDAIRTNRQCFIRQMRF